MFHLIGLLSLSLFNVVHAATVLGPTSTLYVANKQISPDGFLRDFVLAGSNKNDLSFPGPLIQANKGASFNIKVQDQLTNETMLKSTSIHWHGLFQHTTNWADGPSFVTQCPIVSGSSFQYKFTVPDQAGTYWYHSHLAVQYCDGLRGPLVIYDPQDPYKSQYDVDDATTVITLSDWYHRPAPVVAATGGAPNADSTLINGLGRSSSNLTAALAVINVEYGKRYRFRLISMACDPNYKFSIDGHNMTVIEADGVLHEPLVMNQITIYAAQRYSFILNANQNVSNYWVRAGPSAGVNISFDGGLNSAILRYKGAPVAEPVTTAQTTIIPLAETNLHPLVNAGAPGIGTPGKADINLPLALGFNAPNFTVNGYQFIPPSAPVLLQVLSGVYSAQDLLPNGSVYTLAPNKVVEITFIGGNAPGGPHPFHLHGHKFSVVQSAGSAFNYVNPVQRDTTAVAAGQNTTIRFVTDNPGPWFLHCHIDFHLDAGLAVVMAEAPNSTKAVDPVPAAWSELCPKYNALAPDNL